MDQEVIFHMWEKIPSFTCNTYSEGKMKHDKLPLTYMFTGTFDSQGNASGTMDQSTVVAGYVCKTYKLDWEAIAVYWMKILGCGQVQAYYK
jgi:hypothetical protein